MLLSELNPYCGKVEKKVLMTFEVCYLTIFKFCEYNCLNKNQNFFFVFYVSFWGKIFINTKNNAILICFADHIKSNKLKCSIRNYILF